MDSHWLNGTTPISGFGLSGNIARYSIECSSGSRKYNDIAGIQPMTTGSVTGSPLNPHGVTPADSNLAGAVKISATDTSKARCNFNPMGELPIDHKPSIPLPRPPIHKKATCRAGTSYANSSPTISQ